MKTALDVNQLAALRRRPQGAKWYGLVHQPRVVADYDILELWGVPVATTRTILGASEYYPVKRHMTGVVKDTDDNELGRVRIRGDYTYTVEDPLIPIAETGSGLINWRVANKLQVLEKYDLWPIHPFYDTFASAWYVDFDETLGTKYDSLVQANPGAPVVLLPSAPGQWTGYFGHKSKSLSSGGFIVGEEWTFPDGQTFTGVITTIDDPIHGTQPPLEVTFTGASPGGAYYTLTVTDNYGATHTSHRLIFALNDFSETLPVSIANLTGGVGQNGYSANLTLYGANLNGIELDNNEIVIFEQANYGSEVASIGTNWNDHPDRVLFRGWVTDYSMSRGMYMTSADVTANTIHGLASLTSSYDLYLTSTEYIATSKDFTTLPEMTLDKVALVLGQYRSTMFDIVDFQPALGISNAEVIFYQDLPKASLWSQLASNYNEKGVLGWVSADMQSNLWASQDIIISGASDTAPRVIDLEQQDWTDIQLQRSTAEKNSQVQLYAVSSDIPYGAESPAQAMGYFGTETIFEKGILVDSQETLTKWTGNLRAKLNNNTPVVQIQTAGNYKLDAVPQHTISLTTGGAGETILSQPKELFGKVLVQDQLTVNYDSRSLFPLATIVGSQMVDGTDGSAITFPPAASLVVIPPNPGSGYDPPPIIDIPPPPNLEAPTGVGTVYVMTPDDLGRTRAFSAPSPIWADILPLGTGKLYDFILDPWNPSENGYLTSDEGVWKSTSLTAVSPTFTNILSKTDIETALGVGFIEPTKIMCSINLQDYVVVFFKVGTGLYCARSYDGGATWAYSLIVSNNEIFWRGAADYVPHLINGNVMLYVAWGQGATNRTYGAWKRSDDGGATWSAGGTYKSAFIGDYYQPHEVHCPYSGNPGGNLVYIYTNGAQPLSDDGLFRSIDGGTSWSRLSNSSLMFVRRGSTQTYTLNENIAVRWKAGTTALLYTTTDGWATSTLATRTGFLGTICGAGGFPTISSQYYAVSGGGKAVSRIFLSTDVGETWIDKTGNWTTAISDPVVNIGSTTNTTGNSVIVPLWTE